jgi:hypothetical protein
MSLIRVQRSIHIAVIRNKGAVVLQMENVGSIKDIWKVRHMRALWYKIKFTLEKVTTLLTTHFSLYSAVSPEKQIFFTTKQLMEFLA